MAFWIGAILILGSANFITVHSIANQSTTGENSPLTNAESDLWDSIIDNCERNPTVQCIKKTAFQFLNDTLDSRNEYNFGDILTFRKNNLTLNTTHVNGTESTLAQLQSKAIEFLIRHNIELKLPNSPSDTGIASRSTKLEIAPNESETAIAPRLFKKLQKYISTKLINAGLAILLVLALIKVKLMFFVPMILGMATAKKLLLKLLLFVFPFLSHIFQLCPYYASAEGTKFHHHDHSIKHVHVLPPVHKHHPPHYYHHHPHEGEYYKEKPGYIKEVIWSRDGDRNEENSNDKYDWIMSHGNPTTKYPRKPPSKGRPLTPFEIEALAIRAEKEAMIKHRLKLQQEQQRIEVENKLLQDRLKQAIMLQERLKLQALHTLNRRVETEMQPPLPPHPIQQPVQTTLTEITLPPPTTTPIITTTRKSFYDAVQKAAAITYDSFYSPILEKIDDILIKIGLNEEACKERIICSMYKNPEKFSPHSNLISAQLSRDASELQKPSTTNAAVVRFYRYVQAARDGQDKRECLRLYPACAINTEA